jgi:hypothetical protein
LLNSRPQTFATKTDADIWLTMKEAGIHRGDWIDPDAGKILFATYADTWIHDHVLKPRTDELCRGLLKNHLKPTFGNVDLAKIREGDIRRWRKERINAGLAQARPFGPVTVAKACRLLHAIMTTAVEDGLIRTGRCCSWRRSPTCASANSRPCAAVNPTCAPARSA